ncbi:hypothetical protein FZC78_10000 [Rossellomorea vietnamensis]|uniref:Uncharacterized protein n=1 Tax=Rossellomorea vietnamensis TaxID=218284 RepID=A0A5D4NUF0_9BACI|nr:hypothetical protein [Rossellomorea vietnamensis]TYS16956.1 hypothetical protein FZC78_10000 [Rossellomorea vietnamensis]
MTGEALIFLVFAVLLLFFTPFLIIRGIRQGRSFTDQFTSNGMLILLFFAAVGEVLKSVWNEGRMEQFNQFLFLSFILIGAVPALILFAYHFPREMKKWKDPGEYKHPLAYRLRYFLLVILFAFMGGALFMLYQSYKVVF